MQSIIAVTIFILGTLIGFVIAKILPDNRISKQELEQSNEKLQQYREKSLILENDKQTMQERIDNHTKDLEEMEQEWGA